MDRNNDAMSLDGIVGASIGSGLNLPIGNQIPISDSNEQPCSMSNIGYPENKSSMKSNSSRNMRLFYCAAACYIAAQAADNVLTSMNVAKHGLDIEGNSLVRLCMDYAGVQGGLWGTSAIISGIAIPTLYHNKNIKGISSESILFTWSVVHAIAAMANVFVYMQK